MPTFIFYQNFKAMPLTQIRQVIEKKRHNGYRKPGKFYIIGERLPFQCCRIPFQLADQVPPVGFDKDSFKQWYDQSFTGQNIACNAVKCPGYFDWPSIEIAGVLWIPETEYPSAAHFFQEIRTMPVHICCDYVNKFPQDLVSLVDKYILLAHRKAIVDYSDGPLGWVDSHTLQAHTTVKYYPGIFAMFKVTGIQFTRYNALWQGRYKKVYKGWKKLGIDIVEIIPEEEIEGMGSVETQTVMLD
jgi:hypothetical protein